jgi:hypothetical protein
MVTNNAINVATGATSTLLQGAGVGTAPTFTGFPQVSGLGVGASPGSTAGITFDGSNFLNNYAQGTYTPTIIGASTAGTGTYTIQVGRYTRIGNKVCVYFYANTTAHNGTGQITATSLPFTSNSTTNNLPILSNLFGTPAPATTTYITNFVTNNTTNCTIYGYAGVTGANTAPQITNGMQLILNGVYEV